MQKKTIAELELSGTARKNPARIEARTIKASAVGPGDAPEHLGPHQAAAWDELCRRAPRGVLTTADAVALEMAAVLLCQFRADPEFPSAKVAQLQKLLAKFGMDPTARASLRLPEPKCAPEDDPFAEFDMPSYSGDESMRLVPRR